MVSPIHVSLSQWVLGPVVSPLRVWLSLNSHPLHSALLIQSANYSPINSANTTSNWMCRENRKDRVVTNAAEESSDQSSSIQDCLDSDWGETDAAEQSSDQLGSFQEFPDSLPYGTEVSSDQSLGSFQDLFDSLFSAYMKRTFEDFKADHKGPMYPDSRSKDETRCDHAKHHRHERSNASVPAAKHDEADHERPDFPNHTLYLDTMMSSPYAPRDQEHQSFVGINGPPDHGEVHPSQYEAPKMPNEPYYMPHTDWDDAADHPQADSADDGKQPGSPDEALAYPGPGWTSLDDTGTSTSPSGHSRDTDSSDESLFIHHPACGCVRHHGCICIYDWRAGAVVAMTPFWNKVQQAQGDAGHMQTFRRVKKMRGDEFGNDKSKLRYGW